MATAESSTIPPVTRIACIGLLTVFALIVGVANALAADRVFLGNILAVPLAASADPGIAQTLSVLRQQAASRGTTRVIVGVRAAFAPEGLMDAASVTQQRDEIATTQSAVLDKLLSLKQKTETTKRFEFIPFMALEVTPAELEALASLPEITFIEEDRLAAPHLAESVPLIGGATAWGSGYTGAGQTIAILDTGVDKTHPFLAGKVVSEACYSTNVSNLTSLFHRATSVCPGGVTQSTAVGSAMPYAGTCPTGDCDHGTHVAGIAAGTGASYSGVAKDASLIAIQVYSRIDSATDCDKAKAATPCILSYTSDQILGLQRVLALSNAYDIAAVNMSLGGGQYFSQITCDSENTSIKAAIDNLRAANIATVISSGNDGYTSSMSAPGCISSAVSVGATWDVAGENNNCPEVFSLPRGYNLGASIANDIACYSNSASFLNLLAPSSAIASSIPGGAFSTPPWHGTSLAAPHVAGAWALLKQKKTTLTVTEGLTALVSTGVSVTDPRNSVVKPRIKIDAALNAQFTVLSAAPCNYSLSSNSRSVGSGVAVGNVSVTADYSLCAWTAASNNSWITVTSGASGSGNGSVGYSVAANTSASSRTGTMTIARRTFTVTQAGTGSNVALASAGAVASASSSYSSAYPVAALNDNRRTGAPWSDGGGWMDATANKYPDWVQINFNGTKTIDRVVVYTVQDNYRSPIEPTDTLTFSAYGVTDFTVQGWNGSAWVTLTTVRGNNLVKRTVSFAAYATYTTDRIRINITNALASYSRLTEVEAWGNAAVGTPTAATNAASGVTDASATLNGTVNPKGLATTAFFQWGTSTAYGNTTPSQSLGSGKINVSVSAPLTGLTPSTTYHYRVVAANSAGTTNGADLSFTTAVGTPNLTPYQPAGWSDKIVVSNTTGTGTDSGSLRPTDTLYVDWAVANLGTAATATTLWTELYVDGVQRMAWYFIDPPTMGAGEVRAVRDYSIGTLSAGTHSIRIKTDSTGVIAESNETDNEYTKTIIVSP